MAVSFATARPVSRGISRSVTARLFDGGGLASALLGAEANGLAIDFTDMSMAIRDTGTPANAFSGNPNTKLTYSSPSTKWILNKSGVYESGTTLRTEYDASGNPLGVRIEEARTNLFLNSRSPATQNITVSATPYTMSFIGTGTITLSGASTAGPLVGTGANNRVTLTFTPTAGTLTCTVSGTMDFVQVEAGSFATSPIVTAGSSVTRAADDISLALTAFPFTAATSTIFAYAHDNSAAPDPRYVAISAGAAQRYIELFGGIYPSQRAYSAGGTGLSILGTSTRNPTKIATAIAANDQASSVDGGTVQTDATVTVTQTPTTLYLGKYGGGSNYLNSYLKQVMVLPRRMSNAELQAVTA